MSRNKTVFVKRNDNGIALDFKLTKVTNSVNSPVDLTEASVRFVFNGGNGVIATKTDGENGEVRVVFDRSDLSEAGSYQAELEVEYSDGRIETFPNDGYIDFVILKDQGGV